MLCRPIPKDNLKSAVAQKPKEHNNANAPTDISIHDATQNEKQSLLQYSDITSEVQDTLKSSVEVCYTNDKVKDKSDFPESHQKNLDCSDDGKVTKELSIETNNLQDNETQVIEASNKNKTGSIGLFKNFNFVRFGITEVIGALGANSLIYILPLIVLEWGGTKLLGSICLSVSGVVEMNSYAVNGYLIYKFQINKVSLKQSCFNF